MYLNTKKYSTLHSRC